MNYNCPISIEEAYIHSSHVTLVRLPDLLHQLLLGSCAGLDGALHSYGPLRVVHGQVLQTEPNNEGTRTGVFNVGVYALDGGSLIETAETKHSQ